MTHPAEQAIYAHNRACVNLCGRGDQEGVRCKYRPYFPRHCPECPLDDRIEYPEGSGQYPEGAADTSTPATEGEP